MSTDPALDAVRAARIKISHELGNDPARLVEHYARLQEKFRDRLVQGPEDPEREAAAQQDIAADGASRRR
jgi:hypothetical protein